MDLHFILEIDNHTHTAKQLIKLYFLWACISNTAYIHIMGDQNERCNGYNGYNRWEPVPGQTYRTQEGTVTFNGSNSGVRVFNIERDIDFGRGNTPYPHTSENARRLAGSAPQTVQQSVSTAQTMPRNAIIMRGHMC